MYRTQKARGLAFVDRIPGTQTVPHRIIQSADEIPAAWSDVVLTGGSQNLFARPCPERPRHGFVESRRVTSIDEALAVFMEAQAADPMAEMILMPQIQAVASAIYTPTTLAVGPGHDGATSGIGSFGFNLGFGSIEPEVLVGAGITTHPYVEIVYGRVTPDMPMQAYAVQIRDGEVPDGVGDQVAIDTFVTNVVILPENNSEKMPELEWEQYVKVLPPGTVVYHPGGTSTSHYAVHCKLNGIPCIFSHQPKVGELLEKTKVGQDLTDPHAMRIGLEIGAVINLTYREALRVALFGLHQYATNSNPIGSKLQGIASSLLLRLSVAACLGELRHKRRWRGKEMISPKRSIVFEKAWGDMFGALKFMGPALKDFMETRWRSGFGGKAWGVSAMRSIQLSDACVALYRNPSIENAREVISRLNVATNTAHNNGWLFNKFAPAEYMDLAAESDPGLIIKTGPALYKAMTTPRPDYSGWDKARKNRGLTEIMKRLDVEEIARHHGRR